MKIAEATRITAQALRLKTIPEPEDPTDVPNAAGVEIIT